MDLDRYVSELQKHLAQTAETADPDARATAERFSAALDPATRLMLLGLISDLASEITREIAPGSVDVVLRGRDPHLVVTRPAAETPETPVTPPTPSAAGSAEAAGEPVDDTVTSRTTLRLPDRLKARVEQAAADEGISVNAWFVRAIATALEPGARRTPRHAHPFGNSFTGWAS
jgi:hypothetical protein